MLTVISLGAIVLLVLADQLIKYWAINDLSQVSSIPVIKDVLHLSYVENYGAAFGSFSGQKWLLVGLTSVILLILTSMIVLRKFKSPIAVAAVTLIVAGGFGNLIDRIFRGFVVDYVDFRIINFAVFNFADSCVVIGTILLMVYVIFNDYAARRKVNDSKITDEVAKNSGEK